ncbi:MAG TPA: transglycosylase domain-containing protein [Mycobacteriales bacterium]|jgi:penicillin-binding protein 1A|nr:transglycosylase domain-containing protein [Mycobacteriales bacterium]
MALQSPPRPPADVATAVARRRSRSAQARRRRRQIAIWFVVAVLVGLGSFGAGLLAAPLDYSFQPTSPQAVYLLDRTGKVFATIRAPQDQEPVPSSQIPVVMQQAVVAAEDERFFTHSGVDPLAMVRALWRDVTGAQLQGGSTITQQYVKNVYTGSQRTALRKLREASLAIRLEQHLSKEQILTRYLNTLYLGNGAAGVQAASKYYYGVPVQQLDLNRATGEHDQTLALARAATLAGFVPAPSVWNPVKNPTIARQRELYVLNQMVKNRMISSQQASAAYGDSLPKIVAKSQPDAPTVAPEFRDYVSEQLTGTLQYDDTTLFDSGRVRVRTTLDLDLQKAVVHALSTVLPNKTDPEAAVVAVDPRNGDIRALTTKERGGYTKAGFDLATNASRSSGSTIKPFTLAYALMHGHSLDEVRSAPQPCATVPFHICNAEHGSSYQTLRSALIASINTVYGPLAVDLGLGKVLKFARAAGLDIGSLARDSRGHLYPAQSIGVPVTPLSEAAAYGTLVDHGVHHGPRSILRVHSAGDGELYSAPAEPSGDRVMSRSVADQVTEVMQQVVDSGTGTAARQPFPVYGKTGTTDDFTNAWFTGCTRTLCIAVWMGYEKEYFHNGKTPHSMVLPGVGDVFGGTLPARIFAQTWNDYRILQQPHGTLSPTPTPTPVPSAFSARPTSSPTGKTKPRPSSTPSATPSASQSPSTLPTPSPSQTLLPPPTSAPQTPGQEARRERLAT